MKTVLLQYIDQSKIIVIHNWAGINNIKQIPKEQNRFLAKLKINNKFIINYSGNIGQTHNVEILIEVAFRLKTKKKSFF